MTVTGEYFPKRLVLDAYTMGPYVITEFIEDGTQYFIVAVRDTKKIKLKKAG